MIDLELLDSINFDPPGIVLTSSMELIETGMELWLVEPELSSPVKSYRLYLKKVS